MQAVLELEKLGYVFTLEGDGLSYNFEKAVLSDFSKVSSLLGQVRKNKDDAIAFLRVRSFRQAELRIKYNQLLVREKAGEKYLDAPERTSEEIAKWMPLFNEIVAGLNRIIDEIGIAGCTESERLIGFDIASSLGRKVGIAELPEEWRCEGDRN
ncbi:MAG: hypothetical protein ACYCV0_14130, partial [Desulfitobacteriaceae bacterium]